MRPRVNSAQDANFDLAGIAHYDGAVRQCMRAQRHQRNAGNLRMLNRPVSRKRIGGRAGRRGYDQSVCAQVKDKFTVDEKLQFDQPAKCAFIDDNFVERQMFAEFLPIPKNSGCEQQVPIS